MTEQFFIGLGVYLFIGFICWAITLFWPAYMKMAKEAFTEKYATALNFNIYHFFGTVLIWPLFVIDAVGYGIKRMMNK